MNTSPIPTAERVMSERQLKRFLAVVKQLKGANHIDYLMFSIMANTGLRIGEAAALKLTDIDLSENRLIVQNGKGGKRGIVNFGEKTAELFRQLFATAVHNHCWLNHRDAAISVDGIYHKFVKYRDLAGLPDTLTPHSLRHRTACYLLDNGVPLSAVRDVLRHSNVSVTSLYLHLTQDSLERLKAVT